jgi:hypothetical protein
MLFSDFKYLAPKAKQLIPKWAKNWEHPEQIPDFRQAFAELSGEKRKKCLNGTREVGRRLRLAFEAKDEYERDWLLFEARHMNAVYSSVLGPEMASRPDVVVMARGTPLDRLLYIVQTRLSKYMAVCPRDDCKKKFYFRDPGRHGQKYCGQLCFENANREGKLRCYHTSPNSRKNRASR